MIRFQACVGPSQKRVHIYSIQEPLFPGHVIVFPRLTICETTAIFANYRGAVVFSKLCHTCLQEMLRRIHMERFPGKPFIPSDIPITAELLGVREIETEE